MSSTGEKRRRATNTKRKNEINELKTEIRQLRSELRVQSDMKELQPSPQKRDRSLAQVVLENKTVASSIHLQQLDIARIQSTLPPPWETHPLCTRICLDKNWNCRKKTLLDVREQKFRNVYEYIMARIHPFASYSSDDRYETAAGDVCSVLFQTVEFPGVESLKQVFDAVLFSIHNAEISISERLGHVTTRDDYDCGNSSIHNARIVSTNDIGVSIELNCVMFAKFFNDVDESFVCEPCGIIALESVDEDELYPYKANERIRKDVSSAVVVTARYEKGELVATLRRAAFVKFHRPQFDLSDEAWQESQQGASKWGDVMLRSIRSVLYSVP